MPEIPKSQELGVIAEQNKLVLHLQQQVEDLNGVLEELDLLVSPQGSVLKFLRIRNFVKLPEAKAAAKK